MKTKVIIFAFFAMAMTVDGCSDDLPERVCSKISGDGKCSLGFAKDKCAKTCDACKFEYQYNRN